MPALSDLAAWIRDNDALLSGIAALGAVAGIVFSALAMGTRRFVALFRRSRAARDAAHADAPRGASPPAALDAPPPAESDPIVAVLAFDNLSNDAEMQFFSDGISEELIWRLARGTKLRVIGRASSFQLRGERKVGAAEELRCSHVIDGSVRRAAGQVRIHAQLVDGATRATLWAERYDRALEDVFAVQDEIAESIARALDHTFASRGATASVDAETYDLYLRAIPASYAPDELRARVAQLETVTERAPGFAEAWGRLAYLRAWIHAYEPFAARPACAARVEREAARALGADPHNVDALAARLFVVPPFGSFVEATAAIERLMRSPGSGDGRRYVSWFLRTLGRVRESLDEAERAYRLDALDPMTANFVALARMAAGRVAEAVPVYEDLVERMPAMSFPVSSLLRAYLFLGDAAAIDRLLALAERRELREFEDGLAFIRTSRSPTPASLAAWRDALDAHVRATGGIDLARLVYTAHLGLVDDAYRLADAARLGPAGTPADVMGPDAYRPSILFQANMPALRDDPRFPRLCARLGLVDAWIATGTWPDCADEVPYDFRAACARATDVERERFGVDLRPHAPTAAAAVPIA